MRKLFDSTLKDGKITGVYITSDRRELEERLSALSSFVIVTDENTSSYSPFPEKTLVLESGECNKTPESLGRIISYALSLGLGRDGTFVALGGGVVCDTTALAASLYMRGAGLILCPTTLLCMVDATLGGKTAVDYENTKNLVGTFYPASEVIIPVYTLSTLPESEYMSGMGEVVKHALLSNSNDLYDLLMNEKEKILSRDEDTVTRLLELSLLVKKGYIERDPEETKGIRSFLNFGHTFGHALESVTDYGVSHGEAVVWGMKKALTAGLLLGITPQDFYLWSVNLISSYPFENIPKIKKADYGKFLDAVKKDKKKNGGRTRFVFLTERGEPVLRPLEDEQILALII